MHRSTFEAGSCKFFNEKSLPGGICATGYAIRIVCQVPGSRIRRWTSTGLVVCDNTLLVTLPSSN